MRGAKKVSLRARASALARVCAPRRRFDEEEGGQAEVDDQAEKKEHGESGNDWGRRSTENLASEERTAPPTYRAAHCYHIQVAPNSSQQGSLVVKSAPPRTAQRPHVSQASFRLVRGATATKGDTSSRAREIKRAKMRETRGKQRVVQRRSTSSCRSWQCRTDGIRCTGVVRTTTGRDTLWTLAESFPTPHHRMAEQRR